MAIHHAPRGPSAQLIRRGPCEAFSSRGEGLRSANGRDLGNRIVPGGNDCRAALQSRPGAGRWESHEAIALAAPVGAVGLQGRFPGRLRSVFGRPMSCVGGANCTIQENTGARGERTEDLTELGVGVCTRL